MDLSQAPITLLLLLLNALVSGYALFMDARLIDRLSFKPTAIMEKGEFYRLITAGFVHVNLGHLAFNMITLYFFGPLLEVILGPVKFAVLYFGAELAAHGLSLVVKRADPTYAAVGASGAISGVLFAYCLFFPLEKVYVFFALPMWSIVFAVAYVGVSIYAMGRRGAGDVPGGIAHEAHLGGALGGLLLTMLLEPASIRIFLGQVGLL